MPFSQPQRTLPLGWFTPIGFEERGDPRGEYLRLAVALDGPSKEGPHSESMLKRLLELPKSIGPLWITLIGRGRTTHRSKQEGDARKRGRRHRRQTLEADVGLFLRQYARKTKNTPDPNDRHYSRAIEEIVKRMRPEDLDQLILQR